MFETASSSLNAEACPQEITAYYKAQYEQVELELADFQASSKELEAELEKELDEAEKRRRTLEGKVEGLGFEVEEWKRKYKESKTEANAAQSALEKEITTLRDSNWTLQLKLRDIEVANDDIERQARNTNSSLEDLESKYNVAIERAVMMEEEIKIGEQERERLRVEAQRLREELSDLKIEAEILQDKIKKQEARHLSAITTDLSNLATPAYDRSPDSAASSPLITTPPDTKSLSTVGTVSEIQDLPSPPMSDASVSLRKGVPAKTSRPASHPKSRLPSADSSLTPKPKQVKDLTLRAPRGNRSATTGSAFRTPNSSSKPSAARTARATSQRVPVSNSLSHIRTLTAQMARLEARVQSARSKLPAPVNTPPRASPRSSISIPSTAMIRSRKRTLDSGLPGTPALEITPTNPLYAHTEFRSNVNSASSLRHRLGTAGVSRLSFGPLPNRNPTGANTDIDGPRPSSRASVSSSARPASRNDSLRLGGIMSPRSMSRTSFGASRSGMVRPRSSMSGSLQGHTTNVSYRTAEEVGEDEHQQPVSGRRDFRTASRRSTCNRSEIEAGVNGITLPSGIPVRGGARRLSSSTTPVASGKRPGTKNLADLGETY